MLGRVTQNYIRMDFVSALKDRMEKLNKVQTDLTSMRKIRLPSDDPVSTIFAMDYDTRLKEISVYLRNIDESISRLNLYDSNLDSVTSLIQRARELVIQSATGTYTQEDRKKMAVEIDQIIRQLAVLANEYYKDVAMYAGTRTNPPFLLSYGYSRELEHEIVTGVRYVGTGYRLKAEIEKKEYIEINVPGSIAFWGENQVIHSTTPANGWISQRDQTIRIDGVEIRIDRGDTIEQVVDKINSANLPVKASIDWQGGSMFLVLETTEPHPIEIEDVGDGTVMQDLGIIIPGMLPPNNVSPTARKYGYNIFEILMNIRDDMINNNIQALGSRDIGLLDRALDNVLKIRAEVGSKTSRLESLVKRLETDKTYFQEVFAKTVSTDITEAIVELNMLELVHRIGLNVGARLLQPTLLDYIR